MGSKRKFVAIMTPCSGKFFRHPGLVLELLQLITVGFKICNPDLISELRQLTTVGFTMALGFHPLISVGFIMRGPQRGWIFRQLISADVAVWECHIGTIFRQLISEDFLAGKQGVWIRQLTMQVDLVSPHQLTLEDVTVQGHSIEGNNPRRERIIVWTHTS